MYKARCVIAELVEQVLVYCKDENSLISELKIVYYNAQHYDAQFYLI